MIRLVPKGRMLRCVSIFALLLGYGLFAPAALAGALTPVFGKSFNPSTIAPGNISTLVFEIDNSSFSTPITDIAFVDNLPAGMTVAMPARVNNLCINALVVAPPGGSTISVSGGRLAANSICTIEVNVTSSTVGVAMNVSGDLTSSAGNSGPASADLTISSDRPTFTKFFAPNLVNLGERSTLTFTVDNTLNPNLISSTFFTDELPLGMIIANPPNLQDGCNTATLTALPGTNLITSSFPAIGTLPAGASCTISLDVTTTGAGALENTTSEFTATSGGPFTTLNSGRAGAVLQVNTSPDFLFTKAFIDDPVLAGDVVTLAFEITNLNRQLAATNISFIDDLSTVIPGLSAIDLPFVDACGAGSLANGTDLITLTGGSLGPAQSCRFEVTLQVPAGATAGAFQSMTNSLTAFVAGAPVVAPPAGDTLFVTEGPTLTKSFLVNPVGAGETTTLEYTLVNNSNTAAVTDIAFTDGLDSFISGLVLESPPVMTNVCGAGSVRTTLIDVDQRILSLSGGNIPAAGSCTFSIDFHPAPGTPANDYVSTSSIISSQVNGVAMESTAASAALTVYQAPNLTMIFDQDIATPGDTLGLTFTISLGEEATEPVTGINFTNDLNTALAGLTAVGLPMIDVCGVGSQINGTGNLSFTGGSLAPGQTCTFTTTVQIPAAAPSGTITSTTSQILATAAGHPVTGEVGADSLTVTRLVYSKEYIDDPLIAGQMGILRFTIDNSAGIDTVDSMFFTDSLNATLAGHVAVGLPMNDICGTGSQITGTNTILFIGGNLPAGVSCQFDVPVQVPASAATGDYVNVTSSLTGMINGTAFSLPSVSDILTINNDVMLFEKQFDQGTVTRGSSVGLSFSITNTSASVINTISFTDNLGAAIPLSTAVSLPMNDVCGVGSTLTGLGTISLSNATLMPGETCQFSVDVMIDVNTPAGVYTNTTSDVSGMLAGLPVSGSAASDQLLVSSLEFSKSFAGPVVTGQTTVLSYSLRNTDPVNGVSALRFTDDLNTLLSGMTAIGLPLNDVCGLGSIISGTGLIVFDQGSLAAGASCSFDVTVMVPPGLLAMTLSSTTSDLLSNGAVVSTPAVADLMILGQADINVVPASVDFGNVRVGATSSAMLVTVQNTGTAILNVSNLDAASAPFSLVGGSCGNAPFAVPIAGNCTLAYEFMPSVSGLMTQNIMLSSDALSGPQTFELRGVGIEPLVSLSVSSIDFGAVQIGTTSAVMMQMLTNTGTDDLMVSAITLPNAPFSAVAGTCSTPPFVLAPDANCTLGYEFSPTANGLFSDTITVSSDASSSQDSFQLTGEGGEAGLSLSNLMLDFGATPVGSSTDQLLTLSNTGTVDLVVSDLLGPNAPFSLNDVDCGALPIQLLPAAQCNLLASFQPDQIGEVTNNVTVVSNDPNGDQTVSLRGFGFVLVEVPALQQRALAIMALLLLLVAVWRLRIQQQNRFMSTD